MTDTPYPPMTDAESILVEKMNNLEGHYAGWLKNDFLDDAKTHLQIAVTIELATIPIYLGTYYSINRTPGTKGELGSFPETEVSRFADQAGARIMSVAVEEMLHMSLSSNVLFSLGQMPEIYLKAPDSYPAVLPGHAENVACGDNNARNIPIPLAPLSFDQLSRFLGIEYPAPTDAAPEIGNWDTIGQIYSYVRCLIFSKWIENSDFNSANDSDQQIASTEYSPNCIDTVYPASEFDYVNPLPTPEAGSAATVAVYASNEDSHAGAAQLINITNCEDALTAIATIDFQGEGFDFTRYDDATDNELSHYFKFLTLHSQLSPYDQNYIDNAGSDSSTVAAIPTPPAVPARQFDENDLADFVYPFPINPTLVDFGAGRGELVNVVDGLFQYMLIMTETIFKIPADRQKIYFNRAMHQSMIWVLDKILQGLRDIKTEDGNHTLAATFANVDLGPRDTAFATLCKMVSDFRNSDYAKEDWYTTDVDGYMQMIPELPDVSDFWTGSQPPSPLPDYLDTPSGDTHKGTGTHVNPRTLPITSGPYEGVPKWPLTPPKSDGIPENAIRHACMGLNSCRNQGRTGANECAGQGYCSTALGYNPAAADSPNFSDHTCHVKNDCRGQGGCGLYGTNTEFMRPGANDCQSKGSCATPVNAERFITDGDLKGQSVWLQARHIFTEEVWPGLKSANQHLPDQPPAIPGPTGNPTLFEYGPTIGWIEAENDGQGMTACGSSGMSGAGSCA